MTITLLVLASLAAANPVRAALASPRDDRRRAASVAAVATLVAVAVAALVSGPALDLVSVSGSSARIAAGIALVVVCLKDVFAAPPGPEPALDGWKAGLIPLTIPVVFSPALALVAMAGAADRGVPVAVAATVPAALSVVAGIVSGPRRGMRAALAGSGVAGVALGALVVLDGVYAI